MHADLFANEGGFTPRPAWQVIEAARRQLLTGELSLATTPTTHVYMRDGQIYFAERSTDGGLGVRLLVEGVITRQQMGKGALLVSGVEHLGRMFQRDATIDRQSVELCVELMTDDVLTSVANDVIDHYTMTMYKRHANGIDRWLPTRIEVITHIVDGAHLAEPDAVITDGDGPRRRADVVAAAAEAVAEPVTEAAVEPVTEPVIAPVVEPAAAPVVVEATPVLEPVAEQVAEPVSEPVIEVVPEPVIEPVTATPVAEWPVAPALQPVDVITEPLPVIEPALVSVVAAAAPQPAATPLDAPSAASILASAAASLLDTPAPMNAEALFADPPPPTDSGISLAQSAVDAIMSTAIADEVAEAVRRALSAIDACAQPPAAMSPGDFEVRNNAPTNA